MLGRRLRLGVIGGGPGSFIGEIHRAAARLDGYYDIVAGAVSSNPDRARDAGVALGLAPERSYRDGMALLAAEADRPDGVDVVAIMTPNDSHHAFTAESLDRGFDVICDKPMTSTLEEAHDVVDRVDASGLVFCLTHNYSGYPMVRQARAMVQHGDLGDVWLVQAEYVQGGNARQPVPDGDRGIPWRLDPTRSGPSLVMGDIGTHAHHLIRFITGLEVAEVSADIGTIVPDREVDDYGGAMLRFDNGARGQLWATQAAAGVENSIRLRISGSLGTVEWQQEAPMQLRFKPLDGPMRVYTPNGPGLHPLAQRASRIVKGHPEGFHEAFANVYSDAAHAIAARRAGIASDPLSTHFPNEIDGLRGLEFVAATVASSRANGRWTPVGSAP